MKVISSTGLRPDQVNTLATLFDDADIDVSLSLSLKQVKSRDRNESKSGLASPIFVCQIC